MFNFVVRNSEDPRESYLIQTFNNLTEAFKYAKEKNFPLATKGGWYPEIEDAVTGELYQEEEYELA